MVLVAEATLKCEAGGFATLVFAWTSSGCRFFVLSGPRRLKTLNLIVKWRNRACDDWEFHVSVGRYVSDLFPQVLITSKLTITQLDSTPKKI